MQATNGCRPWMGVLLGGGIAATLDLVCAASQRAPALRLLEGFASHAVFVGIPIALAIRWSASSRTAG